MSKNILVAVAPEARPRLAAILRSAHVVWAASIGEATDAVHARHFDLLVLGSHFGESTALDLLERLKHVQAPIACVRSLPFPGLGSATMEAFRAACEALGAALVIDLLDYPDDEPGNERIRSMLMALPK